MCVCVCVYFSIESINAVSAYFYVHTYVRVFNDLHNLALEVGTNHCIHNYLVLNGRLLYKDIYTQAQFFYVYKFNMLVRKSYWIIYIYIYIYTIGKRNEDLLLKAN